MLKKINIITLGCSKNSVDSEHLLAQLALKGYEVVHNADGHDAKIVILNTCGFIGDAKEESIDAILNYVEAKEQGLIDKVYVMGCLSERYIKELQDEIPGVEQYFGARSLKDVVEGLGEEYDSSIEDERVLSTPPHYAYLKISEGCNRACSYCAIPSIRGKHISTPIEQLVREATKLAAKGVKELLVIAQDTTFYGMDLYGEQRIAQLLRELAKIDGIEWIKLHYTYPSQFPMELIEVFKSEPKMCHYIDIPFQHINNRQLSMMRRQTTAEQTQELIDTLRREVPDISIRTTLIAGHAEETKEEFEEMMEFVRHNKFDRLGVFPYSEEEGTYSATAFDDNVSQEEKDSRVEQIMMLQEGISFDNNQKFIGKRIKVLVDRIEGDFFVGRTQYDSPEVDQEVYISSNDTVTIGDFYDVLIESAQQYELFGSWVKTN